MTKSQPNAFTLTGPCESCGAEVASPIPIYLDQAMDRVLADWPLHQVPPLTCPHCSHLWPLKPLVCIYRHSEWLGVALGQKFSARSILSQIAGWFQRAGYGESIRNRPRVVRVFDSMVELSYLIRNPQCSLFRTDVKGRVTSHWDEEFLALIQLSDTALQCDAPVLAYVILAGVVQENAEFFFIPEIRNALEIAANAAGGGPLRGPEHTESPSALEDYREMVAALDRHRPCPDLDDYAVWHDSPLDVNTVLPLIEQAGNQIMQKSPSLLESYRIWLRLLTAGAMVRGVSKPDGSVSGGHWKERLIEGRVKANWNRLKSDERNQLARYFTEISGASLVDIYGSSPKSVA